MAGYRDDEARDSHGRWTGGGSGSSGDKGKGERFFSMPRLREMERSGAIHSAMRGTHSGRAIGHSGAGGNRSSGGGDGGGGGSGPGTAGHRTSMTKAAMQKVAAQKQIDQRNARGMKAGQDNYNRPSQDVMQASEAHALQNYQTPLVSAALMAEASGHGGHAAGILGIPKNKYSSEKYTR
jgi:hypothetical protein